MASSDDGENLIMSIGLAPCLINRTSRAQARLPYTKTPASQAGVLFKKNLHGQQLNHAGPSSGTAPTLAISRLGASPNMRAYSRLNWDGLW
jgi:hypothetical protein